MNKTKQYATKLQNFTNLVVNLELKEALVTNNRNAPHLKCLAA